MLQFSKVVSGTFNKSKLRSKWIKLVYFTVCDMKFFCIDMNSNFQIKPNINQC
jgi:hypothetical protein